MQLQWACYVSADHVVMSEDAVEKVGELEAFACTGAVHGPPRYLASFVFLALSTVLKKIHILGIERKKPED